MDRGSRGRVAYQPMASELRIAHESQRRDGGRPELADVGRLLRRGVRGFVGAARAGERTTLSSVLREHLGDLADAEVVTETWPGYEHVNVQAGLDAWLADAARSWRLVGVIGYQHRQFGLAELLDPESGLSDPFAPRPGSPARVNLACGPGGQVSPCVRCGLYLVEEGDHRTAVLLRGPEPESGMNAVTVQVVSTDPAGAAATAAAVRHLALQHNVFRHQVLSFGGEVFGHGEAFMRFHRRPEMEAGQLVLDEAVLAAVERQVVDVARHKERLLAAGQHLKRGLLLFGPPGVGKTHTVRYLVSRLTSTTVIELSGNALHLIAQACSVARSLQPAMVVVEDVDLIAEERGMHPGEHPLLFQLLNEMDGLAEDADVVFVLTTNRADLLEPALAARPGRVDQAVELTVPDRSARRRLLDLYRGGLELDEAGVQDVLDRTEGVTASFVKELLRRAAVLAVAREEVGPVRASIRVRAEDLTAALDELLDTRNAMTRARLGSPTARELPES